ncbi:MAG: hypothetical protein GXP41_06320 [Chloroflexi bacterium]|nr:hypothetical protein [Chloroflexota bacterium]
MGHKRLGPLDTAVLTMEDENNVERWNTRAEIEQTLRDLRDGTFIQP